MKNIGVRKLYHKEQAIEQRLNRQKQRISQRLASRDYALSFVEREDHLKDGFKEVQKDGVEEYFDLISDKRRSVGLLEAEKKLRKLRLQALPMPAWATLLTQTIPILEESGHQPLTRWRGRVVRVLKACIEGISDEELVLRMKRAILDINTSTANQAALFLTEIETWFLSSDGGELGKRYQEV